MDTWKGSLIWGRVGAAVLTVLAILVSAFGINFGPEDQQAVFEVISGIMAGIGVIMTLISKWKEQYKAKVNGPKITDLRK